MKSTLGRAAIDADITARRMIVSRLAGTREALDALSILHAVKSYPATAFKALQTRVLRTKIDFMRC